MKPLTLTPELERSVLEWLARPVSVSMAAERTGVSPSQAAEIGRRHGYPHVDRVRESLQQLRAGDATVATSTGPSSLRDKSLQTVPVTELHPDPDNPREDLGDLEGLAASMQEQGLIQPVVARRHGTSLMVVAGHRRLAAARLLGWTDLDVIVVADMRPADTLAAMLIENGQRAALDPIEEARAYARLKTLNGWTSVELAARVGRPQTHVDGRLAMLSLSAQDQALVRTGHMGIVHATVKGRARSGRVRASREQLPHFSVDHPLAARARARCVKFHGRALLIGKTACGDCWETVIRADEQATSLQSSLIEGTCVTCDQPIGDDQDTAGDLDPVRPEDLP